MNHWMEWGTRFWGKQNLRNVDIYGIEPMIRWRFGLVVWYPRVSHGPLDRGLFVTHKKNKINLEPQVVYIFHYIPILSPLNPSKAPSSMVKPSHSRLVAIGFIHESSQFPLNPIKSPFLMVIPMVVTSMIHVKIVLVRKNRWDGSVDNSLFIYLLIAMWKTPLFINQLVG